MSLITPSLFTSFAYRLTSLYVTYPEQLRIEARLLDNGTVLVKFPGRHAKEDHGKLIGGGGKNFNALRHLLFEFGKMRESKVFLEIMEPIGKRAKIAPGFKPDPYWAREREMSELLQETCRLIFPFDVMVSVHGINISHENPTGATNLVIHTDCDINPETLSALNLIFAAIGRNTGRKMSVSVWQPEPQK